MAYKGIIFDLDGTLLDTITDLKTATNHALKAYGFKEVNYSQTLAAVGNGVLKLLENCAKYDGNQELNDEILGLLLEKFSQKYQECFMDETKPYPGIIELLKKLNEKNIKIAINTNKLQAFSESLVAKIFGDIKFEKIIGDDLNHPKKPDPFAANTLVELFNFDKKDILYVGDSEVDLCTASNAEVDGCFVAWGFRKHHQIAHIKHKYIVHSVKELDDLIWS
ncbi:MAG: HAD family hydrolase [Erysipelotrichaceae bacterium]|nr:HAD family hydrolase [Erysipelotrichaceae bacterium]